MYPCCSCRARPQGAAGDTDLELPGGQFLQKPFSPEELAAKVRALIDGSQRHRAD
jgi:hypothetical protein